MLMLMNILKTIQNFISKNITSAKHYYARLRSGILCLNLNTIEHQYLTLNSTSF